MAAQSEMVTEFRGIVDGVIRDKVSRAGATTWPNMHTRATAGGLHYVSLAEGDRGLGPVGPGSEHRWGIIAPELRIGRHAAQVALVSVAGQEETLQRRVAVSAPFLPIQVGRELQPDELEAALRWARSPHLHGQVLGPLAMLGEGEKEQLAAAYQAQLREHAALDQVVAGELAAMVPEGRIL